MVLVALLGDAGHVPLEIDVLTFSACKPRTLQLVSLRKYVLTLSGRSMTLSSLVVSRSARKLGWLMALGACCLGLGVRIRFIGLLKMCLSSEGALSAYLACCHGGVDFE